MDLDGTMKPVALLILGGTLTAYTMLFFATFLYGKHVKPKLNLGMLGQIAFGLK
jgi:hypothetical protein